MNEPYRNNMKTHYKHYMQMFMVKNGNDFLKYFNFNKNYYNTNISRFYMEYKVSQSTYKNYFYNLKKIWSNKNILIVEGSETYLGVKDGLLDNAKSIHRIECPPVNSFEHYTDILRSALSYLDNHKINLVLLSLGPTATVLASDLCDNGYRSIDIGHIDVEYNWFLMRAKSKINIPTRYVNDIEKDGNKVIHVSDKKYNSEIVKKI